MKVQSVVQCVRSIVPKSLPQQSIVSTYSSNRGLRKFTSRSSGYIPLVLIETRAFLDFLCDTGKRIITPKLQRLQ